MPPRRSPVIGFVLAVAAVALAILLRIAVQPWVGERMPFAFAILAVLVSAWFAGRAAGLVATVLAGIATAVVSPASSTGAEIVEQAMFAVVAIALIELTMAIHRAEHRGQVAIERLESEAARVLRQVAAKEEAEAALKEADRRKDEFLAILAHELRNPLAPVRLALEMLRTDETRDPVIAARSMDVMGRQLGHLVRLIDDLLDVSRITRGKLELRRGRVMLADVIKTALETSRPQIDAAGHTLTVGVPLTPIELQADLTRLAQVVSNLLNNAAKYTPRGGKISLDARRDSDSVEIRVSDTGIGLAPEHIAKVFEMFAQVGPLTTRAHGGLGIGLALARALVDMHGGRIDATSDGLGRGSSFTVRLPIVETLRAETSAPDLAIAEIIALRVLVADDNRDANETLALFLERSGHTVQTACDGVEAVEAAATFRPDVCVLDIGMPRMDGYEAARRLRATDKDLLLIALTGWGQAEDHRKSREAGFDFHLIKPVQPSTLVKLLATATAQAVPSASIR